MSRRYRIDTGDWVIPRARFNSLGTLARPGKVVEADADGVVVSFRYDYGDVHESFTGDAVAGLMRVRWHHQGGRRRWRPA